MRPNTAIWYEKKEKLINGPTIPISLYDYTMNVYELCSATLNRSHVMLIVASTHPLSSIRIRRVVIFNSVENLWYSTNLQLEGSLNHCRASVAIDKSGKK